MSNLATAIISDRTAASEGKEAESRNGNFPHGVFLSPGGCNEYIPIYAYKRRIPKAQLGEWTGRLTGLRDQGEKITLRRKTGKYRI